MIRRLRIAGFKRFDEHGVDLDLAPITLLLGGNSSGKSSVFQSLLCLEQSWERPTGMMEFAPSGRRTDLGRFGAVLNRRRGRAATHLELEIDGVGFRWRDPAFDRDTGDAEAGTVSPTANGELDELVVQPAAVKTPPRPAMRFRAHRDEGRGQLRLTLAADSVRRWSDCHPQQRDLVQPLLADVPVSSSAHDLPALSWLVDDELGLHPEPEWSGLQDPSMEKLRDEAVAAPRRPDSLWTDAHDALEHAFDLRRVLRRLAHVGGLRERGVRIHELRTADQPWMVGRAGERMVDVLLSVENALDLTNDFLGQVGVPYAVVLRDIGGLGNTRELVLRDLRPGSTSGNEIGLPEVGLGVAQLLPVAVQLAALRSNDQIGGTAILLVEQPELHLHPLWQARLARMFAQVSVPEWGANRVQILAETHSEHLVMAFGSLIYKGQLSAHDVGILVFEVEGSTGAVSVRRIRFDTDGRFADPWPRGFFNERAELLEGKIP